MFETAAACFLGAMAERLRGGWPPLAPAGSDNGAGRARALRSAIFAGMAFTMGAPWWVSALMFCTLWAGLLTSHTGVWKCETLSDVLDMAVLGAIRGVGGLLPLMIWYGMQAPYGDTLLFHLCATMPALKPTVYALAWRHRARLPRLGGLLDDWNAYAELAWGAALGGAIAQLTGV